MEQVQLHHVLHNVQQERYEMEIQARVQKHEHVIHVQQEATVHERIVKQHVEQENGVAHELKRQQIVKQ